MFPPQGRFTIAAKHHITIAEIYETELVDIEKVCGRGWGAGRDPRRPCSGLVRAEGCARRQGHMETLGWGGRESPASSPGCLPPTGDGVYVKLSAVGSRRESGRNGLHCLGRTLSSQRSPFTPCLLLALDRCHSCLSSSPVSPLPSASGARPPLGSLPPTLGWFLLSHLGSGPSSALTVLAAVVLSVLTQHRSLKCPVYAGNSPSSFAGDQIVSPLLPALQVASCAPRIGPSPSAFQVPLLLLPPCSPAPPAAATLTSADPRTGVLRLRVLALLVSLL